MKRFLIALLTMVTTMTSAIIPPNLASAYMSVEVAPGDPKYDFAKALQMSLYFYDANKCGPGITGGKLEWRGDCHVEDTEIPLIPMTEKCVGTNLSQEFIDKYKDILDPDGNGSVDLRGGFHDAGDHVKFGLPQAYAVSTLGWGFYEFRDSYTKTGEEDHVKDILRWGNDYFLRSTFRDKDGKVIAFNYQVGEGNIDHNYWCPPELQKPGILLDFERPAYFATSEAPASDQCAGAAASLAITYMNFKDEDPEYAEKCLDTALALYEFAKEYRGLGYSGGFYGSGYDHDEMAWAAVWLKIATGDDQYVQDIVKTDADGNYTGYMQRIIKSTGNTWQNIWVHCWDTVWGGVFAKLAPVTNDELHWYIFRWNLEYWSGIEHENDPNSTTYLAQSPAGFSVVNPYGSCRYNSAAGLCANVYRKYTGEAKFADWAKDQMEYMLGDNPMERSYLVGYSATSAQKPHHRASHASKTFNMDVPAEQRHTLWGALVGGPDLDDFHKDITSDYVYNEVAVDYNCAFVGDAAGLYKYYGESAGHKPFENFPPKETGGEEYWVDAKVEQENKERTQVTINICNDTLHPPHFETTLKARYYFNIKELLDAGQTIDNDFKVEVYYDENEASHDGPAKLTGPVKYDDAGTYYVEFDWADKVIFGTRELQFALMAGQDANYKSNWDPTNDYSREGLGEEYTRTDKVTFYCNDKLVYGKEPTKVILTPTPTVDPRITVTPTPIPSVSIEYGSVKVLNNCGETDSITNTIRQNFKVANNSKATISLEDLKLRYWYTGDSSGEQTLLCNYAPMGVANVNLTYNNVLTPSADADGYIEIGFAPGSGKLTSGTTSGDVQVNATNSNAVAYNQANDYSFNADLASGFLENTKVTAYVGGKLVAGVEPKVGLPSSTPTPTIINDIIYGDVNGDSKVDSGDYTLMRKYLLRKISVLPAENWKKNGDLNIDGVIDSGDYILLRKYILGIISKLPYVVNNN